jgi:iron complex transport system substrate-binding protein
MLLLGAMMVTPLAYAASSGNESEGTHSVGVQRVIAVGGVLTEFVYALGAGDRLVAVDTTSTYPAVAKKLPQVGYQRALSAEGVLSQNPALILATTDAGPPPAIAQLKASGVAINVIPHEFSLQGTRAMLHSVAAALQLAEQGRALDSTFLQQWQTTEQQLKSYKSQPRVLFVLAHAGGNLQVAGSKTPADAMIQLAGGINAMQGIEGYKPLTAEAVLAAAPDVLLLTTEGLHSAGGADALWQKPGLALTPAAEKRHLVTLDNLYLLGFGPRLPQAVSELAQALRSGGRPSL